MYEGEGGRGNADKSRQGWGVSAYADVRNVALSADSRRSSATTEIARVEQSVYSDCWLQSYTHRDCDQPTTMTSSSHSHSPLGLAAAVSACADQQFGTNFHRICEARTLT